MKNFLHASFERTGGLALRRTTTALTVFVFVAAPPSLAWPNQSFAPSQQQLQRSPQQEPANAAVQPAPSETTIPISIPEVNLEGLEPIIAEQLGALRAEVGRAIQAGETAEAVTALAELARHYHAYEFYDAAAAGYKSLLQLQLDDTAAYLLGLVLRQQGKLEEALQLLSIVVGRQPNYVAAQYYQALTLFELGRFDESRASIPDGADSAAVWALLGRLAMERDQPKEAAGFFEKAVTAEPAANRTHYLLAQAYRASGDREKAAAALQQYGPVGAKPADPLMDAVRALRVGSAPFALAGRKAFAAGRYQEAAELFRKALTADPDDLGMKLNLASALAEADSLEDAVALLREIVSAQPVNSTAQFNLGVLLVRAGRLEESSKHLRAAVAANPGDAAARAQLVPVLAQLGQGEEALAVLEPLREEPGFTEDLRLLEVQLLVQAGMFDAATARMNSALVALPNSGLVAHAGARFFAMAPSLEHRDGDRALELATLVYEASGRPGDAVTVAYALAELGQCDKASEWMLLAKDGMGEKGVALSEPLESFWKRLHQGDNCRP